VSGDCGPEAGYRARRSPPGGPSDGLPMGSKSQTAPPTASQQATQWEQEEQGKKQDMTSRDGEDHSSEQQPEQCEAHLSISRAGERYQRPI
jgi:hypothetical protein